jgi:hypothetical protein
MNAIYRLFDEFLAINERGVSRIPRVMIIGSAFLSNQVSHSEPWHK